MDIQPDFRELLTLLNDHKVEYLIVGGYALAFHGAPRFTGDIDILVRPGPENAKRVLSALAAFGFRFSNLTVEDFQNPNKVVQLGVPPVRIDLITSISGVSWEEAEAHKSPGTFGDVPVNYIGREQYIANKRAAGRKKDLADIEALGEE
jgi:predicted nucleotidyltransferase